MVVRSWFVMIGRQSDLERARASFRMYIPRETVKTRVSARSRAKQTKLRVQFPGYAFLEVGAASQDDLAILRSRYSVVQMRNWAKEIVTVTELEVQQAAIHEAESRRLARAPAPPPAERAWVRVGDWVSLPVGSYGDIEAVVLSIEGGVARLHREGWPLSVLANVRSLVKIDAKT